MLLTIEKLVYGGDGLARVPPQPGASAAAEGTLRERGKAVFIPFVLEGEQVEATLVEEKPGFARARAEQVVAASGERAEAACPYYLRCGGCHYQHTGYEHQIAIKTAILRENLRRLARLEWPGAIEAHRSPPWNYRNRTRVQLRHEPDFALAYYRHGSHELLPIEQCPISSPLINRALAALWKLGRASQLPGALREVEFFADAADSALLLEFYTQTPRPAESSTKGRNREREPYGALWEALRAELAEIGGIAIFSLPRPGDALRDPVVLASFGSPELVYPAAGENYRVSAGSFFQTNRHLADELVCLVTAGRSGSLALDLYAGVGLFSNVLAKTFDRVMAVESGGFACRDLRRNARDNVRAVHATTEQYLERLAGPAPDMIVVDPPRAGLGEKVSRVLAQMAPPRLTYVSCDPATLSRDLRLLVESGFRVEQVHLVDLFPQTFHIESVVHLAR